MASYGALGEGWSYANGPRNGEFLFRGQASVTTAASVTITLPLPIRLALFPQATLVKTTAPSAAVIVSVGPPSGNTFIIYGWQFTSTGNPTLIAATGSWVVNWTAFGNLPGVTPIGNQP
jgi:hypothetical protein